jgi:xanthine dehydrogenase YagR molybdenum-binding subunit
MVPSDTANAAGATANVPAPEPKAHMGQPAPRIDGRLKVTGEARYAADFPLANPAYAYLVTSPVARGRITGFDLAEAKAVPGVLDILTHENARGVKEIPFTGAGGPASTSIRPLESDRIFHDGQIIAMVVADTFEAAREAAYKLKADIAAEPASATFGAEGLTTQPAAQVSQRYKEETVGDPQGALAAADVQIDAEYETPAQHHNPIELFATMCQWTDGRLTVWEPSQFVYGLRSGIAEQLGIDPHDVTVKSPYVGGAFGSKGSVTPRTALVALAAKRLNRPVKLVLTRDQGFTVATYRAETRHRVRMGASRDGKLTAFVHEGWEITSRPDAYVVGGTRTTMHMYAAPNAAGKVWVVRADRNTPGFMRSPPEVPYMFALESAMDELAVKLDMDPVELRRINDTQTDPISKKPYTSRSLMACYDEAARAFGWARRDRRPGSMRAGDWLVGWGCATACYPSQMAAATARVKLDRFGKAVVQTAAAEIGNGAYTVIGQMAAQRLGIPLGNVKVELGDTELPPSPVAGGSIITASACSAVAKACEAIRQKLFAAATRRDAGALAGRDAGAFDLTNGRVVAPDGDSETLADVFKRLGAGVIEEYAEWLPKGVGAEALDGLYNGRIRIIGGTMADRTAYAFGAEFVEVRIHARTGELRVPRMVGAFAAGHIMNPRTARSQLMGGMIWGVSAALHEATEIDPTTARYVNHNLADYLVPVNADIDQLEVIMLSEADDSVNEHGIKGLGELGNVGTNAAVANAVYHATGRRLRRLPIRIEDVLTS